MAPMLNIRELQRTIDEKKQKRLACYESILEKCHKKIIECSKKEQGFCIFIIPDYIFGLPIIKKNECTEFIIDHLQKNGLLVRYTFPNFLYISWGVEEKKPQPKYLTNGPTPGPVKQINIVDALLKT